MSTSLAKLSGLWKVMQEPYQMSRIEIQDKKLDIMKRINNQYKMNFKSVEVV